MLWNWNHRFLGMKDKGVYLAVRILLRVYVCAGRPFSSLNSLGKGRLKNRVLDPGPWSSLPFAWLFCSSPASLACCNEVDSAEAPDCLFSVEVVLVCFLPTRERRLRPLLLTVNFRVAHLDLFVALLLWPPDSFASVLGAIAGASEGLRARAEPDQLVSSSRLAKMARSLVRRPLCSCHHANARLGGFIAGNWQAALPRLGKSSGVQRAVR